MNELREEIELPPLSNYSLENMRKASDEMQREAFQGFFLLAKREREAQLKSSLAANREQKAEIERLTEILNRYPADWWQDSSLKTWFPFTAEELDRLKAELASLRASVGEKPEVPQRINDKPPIHWKENDGWKRHPQTAEEWNWHDDHSGEGDRRSELRLNFAGDLADPHAPDQMAQILRIDLLRIMARMHSAEAYKKSKVAAEKQPVAPTLLGEEK